MGGVGRRAGWLAHGHAYFGGQHPLVPLPLQQLAQHAFRATQTVDIGRVYEIATMVMRMVHNRPSFCQFSLIGKHHGAQTQR